MKKKSLLAAAAAAVLVLGACGDDGGGDSVQDQAADDLLANAAAQDIDVDEGCVRDLSKQLSDEDAQALVGLGPDDDVTEANLSPEGQETALGVLNCIDISSIIDEMIAELRASGTEFDEQCVRDVLEGLDLSAAADGEVPDEVFGAMLDCVDLGG